MFEDDALVPSGEVAEARDKMRSQIYVELYNKQYLYGSSGGSGATGNPEIDYPLDEDDIPIPVDPFERSKAVKPYIAPTRLIEDAENPFGSALDAPLR
jgi:hypothetical protein